MFYVKTNISDNLEIKVDLYDDEIYTTCPICGKEVQVDPMDFAEVLKEGDLAGTQIYCDKCSEEYEKEN